MDEDVETEVATRSSIASTIHGGVNTSPWSATRFFDLIRLMGLMHSDYSSSPRLSIRRQRCFSLYVEDFCRPGSMTVIPRAPAVPCWARFRSSFRLPVVMMAIGDSGASMSGYAMIAVQPIRREAPRRPARATASTMGLIRVAVLTMCLLPERELPTLKLRR